MSRFFEEWRVPRRRAIGANLQRDVEVEGNVSVTGSERMNWRRVLLVLSAVAIVLLSARPADAQLTFIKGAEITSNGPFPCPAGYYVHLLTYTGYFADPALPFPKTGDVTYVVAVAVNES